MQAAAIAIVLAFAAWLAGVGIFALFRPVLARTAIGKFASSHRINLIEQAARIAAGAGLVVRAPFSLTPEIFAIFGWIMIVSSVLLAVLPLRWHAAFAQRMARDLPVWAVRAAGIVALAMSVAFTLSALG